LGYQSLCVCFPPVVLPMKNLTIISHIHRVKGGRKSALDHGAPYSNRAPGHVHLLYSRQLLEWSWYVCFVYLFSRQLQIGAEESLTDTHIQATRNSTMLACFLSPVNSIAPVPHVSQHAHFSVLTPWLTPLSGQGFNPCRCWEPVISTVPLPESLAYFCARHFPGYLLPCCISLCKSTPSLPANTCNQHFPFNQKGPETTGSYFVLNNW